MHQVITSKSYQRVKKSYLEKVVQSRPSAKSMTQSLLNDPELQLVHIQPLATRDQSSSIHSNSRSQTSHKKLFHHKDENEENQEISLYKVLSHIKSFELLVILLKPLNPSLPIGLSIPVIY